MATEAPARAEHAPAPEAAPGLAPRDAILPAAAGALPAEHALGGRLLQLQSSAGNRAVSGLVASRSRGVQRAPKQGAAKAAPKATPKAKKADPFESFSEFFFAFESFVNAVIDQGGAGLGAVQLGAHLTKGHRALLANVQQALFDVRSNDPVTRQRAPGKWQALVPKVDAVIVEGRRVGLAADSASRIRDEIDLVTRNYVKTRKSREKLSEEVAGDLHASMSAMAMLLWEFSQMGESSQSFQREEVSGRKDAEVNDTIKQANARQRDRLSKVKFDPDIVGRHAKVMDTLRLALILARSETPNSAYKARVLFESVEADLRQIWDQGTRLGLEVFESDPVLITVKMSSDELKGKLASTRKTLREHERLVHGKNVEVTLSKERKPGEVKARQKVAKALGPTMVAATAESLAVEDFESALDVIQNHLHKSPVRLKEWVIQRGDQPPMRIADSEALGLHAKAQAALKSYMQALVGALVHAREDYDSIKLGNSRTKLRILGFLGGAEDPGSFDKEVEQLIRLRDNTVDPMIDRGDYVGAFKVFMREKPEVERRVKAEADYDADLDTGYRRLATTMQVVTVALVALVPIAGEAALATLVVEGGVALGTATAAVAGTATAAGAGGAFVGEGSRQLVTGDYDAGKLGSRTFQGGVIGLSAAAPAVTRQVGGALESAGFGAAGGEFVANTAVGEAQNLLSGGDPGMGALTGGLGWGGGKLTTALPKTLQNPVTTKMAQTGVGAGVSAVTGGSALEGGVGAFVGSFAKPPGPGTTSEKPATTAAPSPAAPTPDVSTIPGTGIQPRLPAAPTPGPATAPGPGITPRTPAPVAGDAAPVPAPSAHSVAPTSVPAESVPAPSLAPSHGAGSADTAAPLPVAHADTPAAPPPARLGPNPSSVNSDIPHQPVKGRDLLPSSAVPANLAQTDRPALDHRAGQYELRQDLGPGGRSAAPSHPTAEYPKAEPNRFVDTGDKPVAGISASKTSIVIDSTTGKKFLFKPLEAEHQVGRATKRGILKGEQAPREVAGPMVAEQLGVEAAQGQLIEIDGKKGVLIEWQEKNTLRDLRIADEVAYKRLVESEQFRDAMTSLDALDYLINNLDRGLNTGNYLYEFQNGQLKLSVIDHGLTFTATKDRAEIAPFTRGLPEKYPPELVTKLEQLAANRTEFIEKLRPLVGDAAVEGFDHRLTVMINDMRAKNAGQI